jgi:hypothetical protein
VVLTVQTTEPPSALSRRKASTPAGASSHSTPVPAPSAGCSRRSAMARR